MLYHHCTKVPSPTGTKNEQSRYIPSLVECKTARHYHRNLQTNKIHISELLFISILVPAYKFHSQLLDIKRKEGKLGKCSKIISKQKKRINVQKLQSFLHFTSLYFIELQHFQGLQGFTCF